MDIFGKSPFSGPGPESEAGARILDFRPRLRPGDVPGDWETSPETVGQRRSGPMATNAKTSARALAGPRGPRWPRALGPPWAFGFLSCGSLGRIHGWGRWPLSPMAGEICLVKLKGKSAWSNPMAGQILASASPPRTHIWFSCLAALAKSFWTADDLAVEIRPTLGSRGIVIGCRQNAIPEMCMHTCG